MNLSDPISIVEARDGIEPSNKALQTLPFSFRVPRPLTTSAYDHSQASVTRNLSRDSPRSTSWNPSPERIHKKALREPQLAKEHTSQIKILHPDLGNMTLQSGTQAVIYDCWT
jgi:hypothetical protein